MLVSLSIPDNPDAWPAWLEQQLMSVQLAELVGELPVLTGVAGDSELTLEQVLGDEATDVFESGLKWLPASQIHLLLKNPRLLFEIQEQVLMEGGDYWNTVAINDEQQEFVRSQQDRLFHDLGIEQTVLKKATTSPVEKPASVVRWRRLLIPALTLMLVIGALVIFNQPPKNSWGFQQSGLLSADVSAEEYLDSLADAARQWFNKRPETKADLALRLQQFSDGCQTLINAEHPQLAAADRDWLVERCQVWKSKLDQQLAELTAGTKSVEETREEADATIRKLIDALHARIV